MNINNEIMEFFTDSFAKSRKVLGFSNKPDYYRLVKRIFDKVEATGNCMFISNTLPIPKDRQIIDYITREVASFNIFNIGNEEIILSNNEVVSYKIKLSLATNWQYLLNTDYMNTPYVNDNIRRNMLSASIINIYTLLQNFDFSNNEKPKIIYYGNINVSNSFVLKVLNDAEFKIMYINSEKDVETLPFEPYVLGNTLPLIDINVLLKEAKELDEIIIDKVETVGKTYKESYGKYLFDGITTFRPRQIFHLENKIVHIDSILEDLKSYWNEENRLRPAFKVENDIVYTPNFFVKINGVFNDKYEYKSLLSILLNGEGYAPYVVKRNISQLVTFKELPSEGYSLVYSIVNFKIDEAKLKNNVCYKLSNNNVDLQVRIIKKLNDFMYRTGFKLNHYKIEDFVYLIYNIISDNKIIKLLENFDYPFKVPKLIIFDEKNYNPNKLDIIMLEFLNTLGFDISIISPYGNYYIENNINSSELSTFSLDVIDENFDMNSLEAIKEKKGFLKNFFNR